MKLFYTFLLFIFLFAVSCDSGISFQIVATDSIGKKDISDQYKADIILLDSESLLELIELNRNKVILLHLWAGWCKPCVKELNTFSLLYDKYSDQDLCIILLSNDVNTVSQNKVLKSMLVRNGINFDTYITDASNFKKTLFMKSDFGNIVKDITPIYDKAIPINLLFDRKGNIVFESGLTPYDTLESFILPLLKFDTNFRL